MFEAKQNWLELCAIQLGGALSLPVFMIGYYLGCHFESKMALTQLAFGNGILLILSLGYMNVIAKYRVITVDMAKFIFGNAGVLFAGISMLISMVGWSVIQWQFMKNAFMNVLNHQDQFLLSILQGHAHVGTTPKSFYLGLIMVLSVASGMLFDLPTFYRHARTKSAGNVSLIVLWMVAVLGLESFGLFVAKNQAALIIINQIKLPLLALIMITGMLTNALNIYSASMVMNRLFKFNFKKAVLITVTLSLILSLVQIGDHLPVMLEFIGSSAEAILCMTLSYVLIKGLTLERLSELQKLRNQQFFFGTLFLMLVSFMLNLPYLKNIFITIAVACTGLMFIYYGVIKHETNDFTE